MSKSVRLFWWYWLLAVVAGVILFGLACVFLPELMYTFFKVLLFSDSETLFSESAINYITFAHGVLGAVMVGWGVSLLCVLLGPWRRGETVAWYTVASSVFVWFVIDSGYSLWRGFAANAALNTLFFVLFAIALAATYKSFMTAVAFH